MSVPIASWLFRTLDSKMNVPFIKTWKGNVDLMTYSAPRTGPTLLIPARKYEGQIVALHQKPRNPDMEKGPGKIGKYMWISQDKSFNFPNHEIPLFYCPGQGHSPRSIALIEGGLKAYVFAQLSGLNTISAAGGQFWHSPFELQRTLQLGETLVVG